MFGRVLFAGAGNIPAPLRAGDGFISNVIAKTFAAEVDATLTVADISGGLIFQGTTLTSDVIYTLPTAAAILASPGFDKMDLGDAFSFFVTNSQEAAFDVVIAVGTGITKSGANNSISVPPQCSRLFTLVKNTATTFALL